MGPRGRLARVGSSRSMGPRALVLLGGIAIKDRRNRGRFWDSSGESSRCCGCRTSARKSAMSSVGGSNSSSVSNTSSSSRSSMRRSSSMSSASKSSSASSSSSVRSVVCSSMASCPLGQSKVRVRSEASTRTGLGGCSTVWRVRVFWGCNFAAWHSLRRMPNGLQDLVHRTRVEFRGNAAGIWREFNARANCAKGRGRGMRRLCKRLIAQLVQLADPLVARCHASFRSRSRTARDARTTGQPMRQVRNHSRPLVSLGGNSCTYCHYESQRSLGPVVVGD